MKEGDCKTICRDCKHSESYLDGDDTVYDCMLGYLSELNVPDYEDLTYCDKFVGIGINRIFIVSLKYEQLLKLSNKACPVNAGMSYFSDACELAEPTIQECFECWKKAIEINNLENK